MLNERVATLERRLEALEANRRVFPVERCEPEALALKAKELVAARFGFTVATIEGRERTEHVAWARFVAMYLARKFTFLSTPRIGLLFDREHGTVMYALREVTERVRVDRTAAAQVRALEEEFETLAVGRNGKADLITENAERRAA